MPSVSYATEAVKNFFCATRAEAVDGSLTVHAAVLGCAIQRTVPVDQAATRVLPVGTVWTVTEPFPRQPCLWCKLCRGRTHRRHQ